MSKYSYTAWQSLHHDKDALKKLSPDLRNSWKRSLDLNIDPEQARPHKLKASEFERIKRETKSFYIYTGTVVNSLLKQITEQDMGLMLFSRGGCLLRLYGSEAFTNWAGKQGIIPGTMWSESLIGANIYSVGITREEGTAMLGEECFSQFLLGGAYYYAPIKLENVCLYGGICITVPREKRDKNFLQMAMSVSRAIELQIFWFNMTNIFYDMSDGYGMFCLDQSTGKNHILIMSGEAHKMLNLNEDDVYYQELENHIDNLPANKDLWNIINKKIKVVDKGITITSKGITTRVSVSTSIFKEKKFHMNGIAVVMNSYKRINKLITKYSGNTARYVFDDIIGQSPACLRLKKTAKSAAPPDSSVLLLGESGVGKDIIAQAIHNSSMRKDKPFVAINCASFSKELIGSELFGYESGAFSGAKKDGSIGKFELADTGTLFLDEIGDMPLDLQAVLLRVLEQKTFMKVGGTSLIRVDVRIIAATNRNLMERVHQGLFREDLFYRLGIIRLQIPALRERGDDVLLLSDHFIQQICSRLGLPRVSLSPDAADFFRRYHWPGNVRELQNLLEGIISTHESEVIDEKTVRHYLGELGFMTVPERQGYMAAPSEELALNTEYDERRAIVNALQHFRNNRSKAAAHMGLSRRTFYRRLNEYGLL